MRLSKRGTTNWASTPQRKLTAPKPMSKLEFQTLCTRLHIDDNGTAAELLGPSWRSCQRYWYGEQVPPPALAQLLRLAARHEVGHAELRALADGRG